VILHAGAQEGEHHGKLGAEWSRRLVHAGLIALAAGLTVLWAGSVLMLGLSGMLTSVDEEWDG
jgi:hypothetical protein